MRRYGWNPAKDIWKYELSQRLYHARRGGSGEEIPRGEGFEGVVIKRSKRFGPTELINYTLQDDKGHTQVFGESVLEPA